MVKCVLFEVRTEFFNSSVGYKLQRRGRHILNVLIYLFAPCDDRRIRIVPKQLMLVKGD
jgi:hypothetical protein